LMLAHLPAWRLVEVHMAAISSVAALYCQSHLW